MKAKFGLSWVAAKKLLVLGIPLIPSFGYMFIIMNYNKFLLQKIHGLDEAGFYSVGFNIGMAIGVAINGFGLAWTPYFLSYINKQDEAKELFGKITSYFVILVGTASLMFFIFSKPVIMVMTAPVYHIAYPVVGFVACSQFMYGLFCLLLPGVYFNKETWAMNISQGLACLAYIQINKIMLSTHGFMGAAYTILAGYALLVIFQIVWNKIRSNKYLNIKYEPGRLSAYAVLYVAVAGATLIQRNFSLPVELLMSIGLAAIVLGVCFFLITPDEKAQFISLVKSIRSQMTSPGPPDGNGSTGT